MSADVSAATGLKGEFNYLVLARHGQSVWNLENRFTGYENPELTEKGLDEAVLAGQLLVQLGVQFDEVHSSLQARANKTGILALTVAGQDHLIEKMIRTEALNERHYGKLQGLNKAETAAKYGDERVAIWRRSYDVAPPDGESLKDVVEKRTGPYIRNVLIPKIKEGKNILVPAHGNSLRAGLIAIGVRDPESIFETELETGVPLVFKFNKAGQIADAFFLKKGGPVQFKLPSKPFTIPENNL